MSSLEQGWELLHKTDVETFCAAFLAPGDISGLVWSGIISVLTKAAGVIPS